MRKKSDFAYMILIVIYTLQSVDTLLGTPVKSSAVQYNSTAHKSYLYKD